MRTTDQLRQPQPPAAGETLIEEGIVTALIPASGGKPSQATVRLEIGEHCGQCAANVLCRPADGDRRMMDVLDPIGVAVGDRVQVAVPGGAVLKASLLVYGLPLLLLLAGVGIGMFIWPEGRPMRDLWSFLLGIGLAAAALPFVRHAVRRAESGGGRILPARIVGVCGDTETARE